MAGAYVGLFLTAFGAATLLPLQSEALLVALLLSERQAAWLLMGVATLGNVLGSLVNWWLGTRLEQFKDRRWFPVSPSHLDKARRHYQRYGYWSLLLSWLPIIGDPLTLVAGVMGEPWRRFLLIVTLAKGLRYGVLVLATLGWMG
ncbi:YqaA family protein [Pseudomonas brassicacearum]|jgi:membrane protein YqaA with SNARE-associated domain|uniref:DedA family protein n=1 Tax=Pseudomonas brassicacearum subsp. neoaurantiaca TaxID=494916 RepID=A0A7V8ZV43_9PSED|nr:YqaA family protein [Pseudomonas brassicacearum]MBA1380818.1 DedA family protein [Pseudomonas brassicacearum subsp. neoaurantiaca]